MLKTNCKKVREAVRAHVLGFFNPANYDGWVETEKNAMKFQIDYMRNKGESVYQAAYRFAEGGGGLISDEDMRHFLKDTLEETDSESEKYDRTKVFKLYCHLFAREAEYIYCH